jgi:O-antigen ligase
VSNIRRERAKSGGAEDSSPADSSASNAPLYPIVVYILFDLLLGSQASFAAIRPRALLLAAGIWGLLLLSREGRRARISSYFLVWGVWLSWAGVTLLAFPLSSEANFIRYKQVFLTWLLALMIGSSIRRREHLTFVLWFVVLSYGPVLIASYGSLRQSAALALHGGMDEDARFTGTLGQSNAMGMYSSLVVCAAAGLGSIRTGWKRLLAWSVIPPAIFAILATGSRKGVLAVVAIPVVMSFLVKRKRGFSLRAIAIVLGLLISYFAMNQVLDSPFGTRFDEFQDKGLQATGSGRRQLYIAAWLAWLDHPLFGVGFDNYRRVGFLYGGVPGYYAHSTPLENLASLGLVGFVLFYGAQFLAFRRFMRARRQAYGEERTLLDWGLATFLILMFFSVFSVIYDLRAVYIIPAAFISFAYLQRGAATPPAHSGIRGGHDRLNGHVEQAQRKPTGRVP